MGGSSVRFFWAPAWGGFAQVDGDEAVSPGSCACAVPAELREVVLSRRPGHGQSHRTHMFAPLHTSLVTKSGIFFGSAYSVLGES